MATAEAPVRERSVGELFGALASETSTLVRQEITLASTEIARKAKFAARQAAYVAAGVALGMIALLVVTAGIVMALGLVIPMWAAALGIGVLYAIAAVVVARTGLAALSNMELALPETMTSLKEDKRWITNQLH